MPAEPPVLDSRTLAQIVQQLLSRADAAFSAAPSVPRWQLARQLSEQEVRDLLAAPFDDPGLMLALTYARLLELALQRLNQVPEKNLFAFLDATGVGLLPPVPARVPLTFALTPGTPATRVPRGAQGASLPSAAQPAVVFETEDDLTVLPATLAAGLTIDPTWDRYTDQTTALAGANPVGFTPFVGSQPLPHRLYLGHPALLEFARESLLAIEATWTSSQPLEAVQRFFERLLYSRRSLDVLQTIAPSSLDVTAGQASVEFAIPASIDLEALAGVGLESGLESRWLRAELSLPFPDDPVASSIRLDGLRLRARASGIQPELGFVNTAPLELSTDFLPFGEAPKVGDAFYLASGEAFGKPDCQVTLKFETTPLPEPRLRWDYSATREERPPGWRPLLVLSASDDQLDDVCERQKERFFNAAGPPFLVDSTDGFRRDGRLVGLADDMTLTLHNGVRATWLRARLAVGGYTLPPTVDDFAVTQVVGSQTVQGPPQFGFADQSEIDFGRPFLPLGIRPTRASSLAIGLLGASFPTEQSDDRGASSLNLEVKLAPNPPPGVVEADLRWEYFGPNGWTEPSSGVVDGTLALLRGGSVSFRVPDAIQGVVGGQTSHWVRARLNSGGYGEPALFEPVDPTDPAQGFQQVPGTGDLRPPSLRSVSVSYEAAATPTVVTQNGFLFSQPPGSFRPFHSVRELQPAIQADPEPAFYLGFDAAYPGQPVSLYLAAAPRAFAGSVVRSAGAAPLPASSPVPLRWEYFDGAAWSELTVFDGTTGLTESGSLEFLTPPDIAPLAKVDQTVRYWLRARSAVNDPFDTQRLQGVFLNTTAAVQAVSVVDETLGSANGEAGQQLRFARPPVLVGQQLLVREPEPPAEQERKAILAEEGLDAIQERRNSVTGEPEIWVRWHEVGSFLAAGLRSRHYLLDHVSGLLTFGDGRHGLIPPRGTNNVLATYQSGGGPAGNVPLGAVGKLQSPLPGLASVRNPVAADGGAAVETVDQVKARGPQSLRHRQRAVSASDFEWLARQAAGTRVARARRLPNVNRALRFEPGWVTLVVVPQGTEPRLAPGSELVRDVQNSLEAAAFAGLAAGAPARISVIGAGYLQVVVAADLVPLDFDEAEAVKQRAAGALDAFLHPLTGGPRGSGWEFGRDVYESEISQVLEEVPGVSHVKQIELLTNQAQQRLVVGPERIVDRPVPEASLVFSSDRRKQVLLAEPLPAGVRLSRLAVKGFKEGDRLTRVVDLQLPSTVSSTTVLVDGLAWPALTVEPLAADPAGFPRGSRLSSFDGARQTRLVRAIPRDQAGQTEIVVEDQEFVALLQPGELLTAFYPFPLTVTALTLDDATGRQTIGVEPYQATVGFPAGSLLASLDNRARQPLDAPLAADGPIAALTLTGFQSGEQVTVGDGLLGTLTVQQVGQLTDLVYLDENFLVYPGQHRLTMRAE